MIRVEISVVLLVPGDDDDYEDVDAAYGYEDAVRNALSLHFTRVEPEVEVDYVSTLMVGDE